MKSREQIRENSEATNNVNVSQSDTNVVTIGGEVSKVYFTDKVTSFSLAVRKVADGKVFTTYIKCTSFNNNLPIPDDGDTIVITGSITSQRYTDKDGYSRYQIVVIYDNIELIEAVTDKNNESTQGEINGDNEEVE